MRHRVLTAVLTLLFSVGCCLPALAAEKQYENLTDLGLTSKSALLMEEDTGTILYEQNSHEALPPASVTKVMTLLLIYEGERDGKFDWTDTVQVSPHGTALCAPPISSLPVKRSLSQATAGAAKAAQCVPKVSALM